MGIALDPGVDQGGARPVRARQGDSTQPGAANPPDLVHIDCSGDGRFQRQGNFGTFRAVIWFASDDDTAPTG